MENTPKFTRLFFKNTVQDRIHIHPKYLSSNLDEAILSNIQAKVEGICGRDGYVKKKSVQLLKRSIGLATTNNMNGYVTFDVNYSVDVCHPNTGDLYPCIVKMKNKVGFLAEPLEKPNPLVIVVVKQQVDDKSLLNNIQIDEFVLIKVIGARYDLGDDKISVVGNLVKVLKKEDVPAFLLDKKYVGSIIKTIE